MGIIKIGLVDENGLTEIEVASDTHLLDDILPDFNETEFQCLRFVDAYGDTVFNRLQMSQVGAEWEKLALNVGEPEMALFQEVRALIQRCAAEPHMYLKFYGD